MVCRVLFRALRCGATCNLFVLADLGPRQAARPEYDKGALSAHTIGLWSGGLVLLSIVPYGIRTYEGKVRPVPTSWALWSVIGLAILLTYRSSGAGANVWPAVFGFTNPTLITLLSVLRHQHWKRPSVTEWLCLLFGMVSLAMWMLFRQQREFAEIALYVAIAADVFAAIPTIVFVWRDPAGDRPLPWLIFAAGYSLALLALPQNTLANWALPVYMVAIALAIALPLVLFRVRRRVPLWQWA